MTCIQYLKIENKEKFELHFLRLNIKQLKKKDVVNNIDPFFIP